MRWWHKERILVLLSLCTQLVQYVSSNSVLHVQLLEFTNDGGKDFGMGDCDKFVKKKCDTVFIFCWDNGNRNTNDKDFILSKCPHFFWESEEYGNTNDVIFPSYANEPSYNLQQTLKETFTGALPNNMEFRVLAFDDDASRPGDHDDIDKLYMKFNWNGNHRPHKSVELSRWREHTMTGTRGSFPHQKTTLKFRYKVYCLANYFGSTCGAYCVARDDNYGHYTCDPDTGGKVCKPGWEGSGCGNPVNDCVNHQCQNGASCQDRHLTYACNCKPGFTGQRCELEVNECSSQPCQHGSTCVDGIDSYTCLCTEEFTGRNCQNHVCHVDDFVCQNGGTCYGNRECACQVGFSGTSCEKDDCIGKLCDHGGYCIQGECVCVPGYHGNQCQIDLCDDVVNCYNGGTCHLGNCTCTPGYTEQYCHEEINECVSNPCQYDGTCRDLVNGYVCDCLPAYTGVHCEDHLPTPTDPPLPTVITTISPNDTTNASTTTTTTTTRTTSKSTTDETFTFSSQEVNALQMKDTVPEWGSALMAIIAFLIIASIIIVLVILYYKRRQRRAKDQQNTTTDTTLPENFDNPLFTSQLNNMSVQNLQNLCAEGAYGAAPTENVYLDPISIKCNFTKADKQTNLNHYDKSPGLNTNTYDSPPGLTMTNTYDTPPGFTVNHYETIPERKSHYDYPPPSRCVNPNINHYNTPRNIAEPIYATVGEAATATSDEDKCNLKQSAQAEADACIDLKLGENNTTNA